MILGLHVVNLAIPMLSDHFKRGLVRHPFVRRSRSYGKRAKYDKLISSWTGNQDCKNSEDAGVVYVIQNVKLRLTAYIST